MPSPRVEIHYCTQCRFMLRAAYLAQELLATFEKELGEVALAPRCSASRHVRHAGLVGQALESILDGGRVAQGAVLAALVVEADVVLKEPLPLLQRSWADPVPELLLDGALHPFHLAVEV